MAIGGVVINFIAKTKAAIKDVDALEGSIRKVGDRTSKTSGTMGKLGTVLTTGLAAGALAAGYGMVKLGEFMVDAGKAAYDDWQQAEKLADTLRKIPGVTQKAIDANADWIDSMELATHVSDTDLREAIRKLTLATGDLDKSQRLAAAAADLATLSGKSYSTVADAMAKAATGNTTALKRLAPWLDTNKDGTVGLTEAMKLLEGQYSDTAEAAADQDVWGSLKTIWGQLTEALGQWLLPLLDKFKKWFADPANKRKVQEFMNKAADLSYQLGTVLVQAIQSLIGWLTSPETRKGFARFVQGLKIVIRVLQQVWSWLMTVIKGIETLVAKMKAIPGGRDAVQGAGRNAAGATTAAGPRARAGSTTTMTPAQPQTVIVTEEQVYRAITRLLKLGDARNGIVRVA